MGKIEDSGSYKFIDTRKVPTPKLGDKPITGERYSSREFMELEWENVWTKTWLVAGIVPQIPNPGDYFTTEIGRESVIIARGQDNRIRAFYNVCPHRGNRMVDEDGSGKSITCPYHGWRFDLTGELKSVPCPEDFPQGNPCGKLRMTEIPCEVWEGFIWYSLDGNIGPLEDYLGPLKAQFETYRLTQMKRVHWVTVEGDFNWKVPQDNFNESYHLPFVHPQTKYMMEQSYKHCQFDMYEGLGHTRMFMPGDRPTLSLKGEIDTVLEWFKNEIKFWDLDEEEIRANPHALREIMQKVKREKGPEKGFDFSRYIDDQLTDHYHYVMFPNLSFSLKPEGFIFSRSNPHPTDPNKSFFDFWYFVWYPQDAEEYYCFGMEETYKADYQAEHIQGKYPDVSCGPAIDQDVSIFESQHKGLQSRAFKREYLSGQEQRIRFFHETLDKRVGG